jgi:formiminotetrahydrofolate cyclodeaminase
MVARLTLGRSNEASLDGRMTAILGRAEEIGARLTVDIDRDSAAYTEVMKAYRMVKTTDGEKAARQQAIQAALTEAARVPMSVAEAGVELLDLSKRVIVEGNVNAVTDGAVGALMARSAVLGALLNVRINLSSLKDESFVSAMAEKADILEIKAREMESEILSHARAIMEREG